eukprot:1161702-Pelagomonas_calceolata.AAC.9
MGQQGCGSLSVLPAAARPANTRRAGHTACLSCLGARSAGVQQSWWAASSSSSSSRKACERETSRVRNAHRLSWALWKPALIHCHAH